MSISNVLIKVLDEKMLNCISKAQTTKKVWDMLKSKHEGSSKVVMMKLHILRQEFETTTMKNGETIWDFINKILAIVY